MAIISFHKNITQFRPQDSVIIKAFTDDRIACKLMSMGVLPGSLVRIMRVAPLRGGYCLNVNGNKIAVRHNEAATIEVE